MMKIKRKRFEVLFYSMLPFLTFFFVYVVFILAATLNFDWDSHGMIAIPLGGMFFISFLFMRNTYFKLYVLFNVENEKAFHYRSKIRYTFLILFSILSAINITHCFIMYNLHNFTNACFGGFLFLIICLVIGGSVVSCHISKMASEKLINHLNEHH